MKQLEDEPHARGELEGARERGHHERAVAREESAHRLDGELHTGAAEANEHEADREATDRLVQPEGQGTASKEQRAASGDTAWPELVEGDANEEAPTLVRPRTESVDEPE